MQTKNEVDTQSRDRTSDRSTGKPEIQILSVAKEIYALRRRRNTALPEIADLFHDPAWDIMLDLFIAAETNAQISVSSACIGSGVPSSTALRALTMMEKRGVVECVNDPFDARRRYVSLSDTMRQRIRALLTSR